MADKMLEAFDNDKDMEEFFDFDKVMSWDMFAQKNMTENIKIEIEANRDIFELLSQKANKAGISLNSYIKIILAERAGVA